MNGHLMSQREQVREKSQINLKGLPGEATGAGQREGWCLLNHLSGNYQLELCLSTALT